MTKATEEEHNEIVAESRAAKHHHQAAAKTPDPAKEAHWPIAALGAGVTVGSAAVAAAFLYANRSRKK